MVDVDSIRTLDVISISTAILNLKLIYMALLLEMQTCVTFGRSFCYGFKVLNAAEVLKLPIAI